MNQNYVMGIVVFGFGVLTGYVVAKLLEPKEKEPQGLLEGALAQLYKSQMKGLGQPVSPWQIPMTRDPKFNVGWFSPDQSEQMRGHLADNVLTYL